MFDADKPAASSGLSWGLGSFLFKKAFAELAAGLKWMFWGLVLQLAGGGVLLCGLAAAGGLRAPAGALIFLPVALTALGVGGLVVLWGEQKCLHISLPLGMTRSLPGHAWLRAAYACHLASILSRFARRWLPVGLRGVITMPLEVFGFVFLLLFLRKLASVIARQDLKRLIDAIIALAGVAALCCAAVAAGRAAGEAIPRQVFVPLALGCGALALLAFLGATASYAALLWRMAAAVNDFAQFLASDPPAADAEMAAGADAVV